MKQGQASGQISYSQPTGIKQGPERPGLAETNYGNCGTQGPNNQTCSTSGSPGIKGTNKGNCGSQS